MDQYAILARFSMNTTAEDQGIGAPLPVSGHEADRLAGLARGGSGEMASGTAWWRRRLRAAAGHSGAGRTGGTRLRKPSGGGAAGRT
jgi:hypothetical protein